MQNKIGNFLSSQTFTKKNITVLSHRGKCGGKCSSLAPCGDNVAPLTLRERVSEGQERRQSGLLRRFAPRNDGCKNCSSPEGEVRWGASHAAFTLTEVLLACVIVGVISALVLPVFVSKYRQKSFDLGFERMTKTLNNALDNLIVTENKGSYFSTMMYVSEEPETYENNSGQFIKKYLKLSKYCGDSNRDCFANVYYKYENKNKSVYNPEFKGACGSLKNGSSICLTPQISANSPQVLIDINGKKGPNVLGQDLRTFTLNLKTRTALNTTTQKVETTEASYEINNTLNCQRNPESLACCEYQGVTNENKGYCCKYDELSNNPLCCNNGINETNKNYCCVQEEFAGSSACCKYSEFKNSSVCCATNGVASNKTYCCSLDEYKTDNACSSKKIAKFVFGGMGYDYSGRPNPNVPSPLNLTGEKVPKGFTVSYSSNIAWGSTQSDNGSIKVENSYVMSSSNFPKNMSISISELSYTCSHTFSTPPNKNYCGGGNCLPRLDTRLYFEVEYMLDYSNNFMGYTGRVSCYTLGDEHVTIRKDF